jgi:hypothetical protein
MFKLLRLLGWLIHGSVEQVDTRDVRISLPDLDRLFVGPRGHGRTDSDEFPGSLVSGHKIANAEGVSDLRIYQLVEPFADPLPD